ncbi:hypothetical protein NECAME_09613 [Necator americanus]|uniref:Uncharacterized protein n=1 Tax=Necator americanus TaxID=51031 RepID=W2TE08_NECAM|nr:hypothetical protein NECAME_09613 [Necator americanus]ETN79814.1 hypothetical protein NECAME_09613 [Necator americanus]
MAITLSGWWLAGGDVDGRDLSDSCGALRRLLGPPVVANCEDILSGRVVFVVDVVNCGKCQKRLAEEVPIYTGPG